MSSEFVLRISADDAATATIKKIQAAISKITDPIDKAQSRFEKIGNIGQAGLDKIHDGLSRSANAARSMADSISSLIPGMTALASLATLGGIAGLSTQFAGFGFNLSKTSAMIGENRQSLQEWIIAGKRAHITAEDVASGLNSMNMKIRGAASGADPETARYMQKAGVDFTKKKNGKVDYTNIRQNAIDAIARQESAQAQQELAEKLGATSLLAMIQRNTYNQDRVDARNSGLVKSDKQLDEAKSFQERIDRLKETINDLTLSIGGGLAPVLSPVVENLGKWFDSNKEKIAEGIASAVGKFTSWLEKIDWDKVGKKVEYFWDKIGGLEGLMIGIAAITFAGPIAGLASILLSLTQIATALSGGAIATFFGLPGAAAIAVGSVMYWLMNKTSELDNEYHKNNPTARDTSLKSRPGVSSPYGMRKDPNTGKQQMHAGIDYAAPAGTPIFALKGGRVVRASDTGDGYGKMVEIDHGDGTKSRYAHARKTMVEPGQMIEEGRQIAEVGRTGNATGNHTHYEVLKDGKAIDPATAGGGLERNPISIVVNTQPGTRVEAKSSDGSEVPAKISYQMGVGQP